MKAAQPKTKVVVRKLPPNLAEADFVDFLEKRIGGIYNWLSFYPGKITYEQSILHNLVAFVSELTCDGGCSSHNNAFSYHSCIRSQVDRNSSGGTCEFHMKMLCRLPLFPLQPAEAGAVSCLRGTQLA